MIWEITLRQDGDSVTATLPEEMVKRLQVAPGDRILAMETPNGVLLTPRAPAVGDAIQAFDEVWRQYRNAFKKLA